MKTFATAVVIFSTALLGCAASEAERQACYARGELEHDEKVQERCISKGHRWTDCPARPAILAELAEQKQGCP